MNKKDIALTVGGVLATMVLAWLLYRLQKRDSAAAAQAAAQAQTDQEQNTDDLYSLLSAASYGGSYGSSSATTTPTIDTNADLATTGNSDEDGAAGDSILTTLLGDLSSSLAGVNESSLLIPTKNAVGNTSLNTSDIPTTAAEELGQQPGNPTQATTTDVTYVPPIDTTVVPRVGPISGGPSLSQLSVVN